MTQESRQRVRVFRTSDLEYHLSVEIFFFETEAKDLPHPLNKRRIEFRVFTSALAKRHGNYSRTTVEEARVFTLSKSFIIHLKQSIGHTLSTI